MNDDVNIALDRATVWAEYSKRRRYFALWMTAFVLLVVPGFIIARMLPPDSHVRQVVIVVVVCCGLVAGVVSFIMSLWCCHDLARGAINRSPTRPLIQRRPTNASTAAAGSIRRSPD